MTVKEYFETGQLAHRPINRIRNIFDGSAPTLTGPYVVPRFYTFTSKVEHKPGDTSPTINRLPMSRHLKLQPTAFKAEF